MRTLSLLILLLLSSVTHAQIVTDPNLNQILIEFQQNFPQYVEAHPELTSGSTRPINLSGGKAKISFTLQQQGNYQITYGSLVFSPTNPISSNRFHMSLQISILSYGGSAQLKITDKKGKTYDIECQNNQFTVNDVLYTATVELRTVGSPDAIIITNPQVTLDPKKITVNLPCLNTKKPISPENLDYIVLEHLATTTLSSITGQQGSVSQGTLNKTQSAINSAATQPNSAVSQSSQETAYAVSTSVATSASSPCSGVVLNDAKAVILELANIAAQANSNGFKTAMQQFINTLSSILPTLSPPSQALVQQFINDLNAAIADGSITTLEQLTLLNDLYNLVLSTGITQAQLQQIIADLNAVLSTLQGISTAALQSSLQKLYSDAQGCLRP